MSVQQTHNQQVLKLLTEIHEQNEQMLSRVEELERAATKRGAAAGAVAGGISGSVITVGIEFIRLKFGG